MAHADAVFKAMTAKSCPYCGLRLQDIDPPHVFKNQIVGVGQTRQVTAVLQCEQCHVWFEAEDV